MSDDGPASGERPVGASVDEPMWPTDPETLRAVQRRLASLEPPPWRPPDRPLAIGSCFARFARGVHGPGAAGDPVWVAATVVVGRRLVARSSLRAEAAATYTPGLLALRVGSALATALARLTERPDVLVVDATGRDHPRRAGLALHLGAALDLPSVGVTHRPLVAAGDWPDDERGATSPLLLDGEPVGAWVRTRAGTRPLAVDAGWRTTPEQAAAIVMAATARYRTPTPLREARRIARSARARDQGPG